jgi:hypothetical protein
VNLNFVFVGLALIGIGLAVLFAPLPLQWWPNMSKGLIQTIFGFGLLIFVLGLGLTAIGVSPVLKDRSLWPQTGMVVFAAAFIACAIWYFFRPPIFVGGINENPSEIATDVGLFAECASCQSASRW